MEAKEIVRRIKNARKVIKEALRVGNAKELEAAAEVLEECQAYTDAMRARNAAARLQKAGANE